MKARDYFRPAGQEKGKFIQNRLGATLGGPVVREKVFFFSSFGGIYQRDNGSAIICCLRRLPVQGISPDLALSSMIQPQATPTAPDISRFRTIRFLQTASTRYE